MIQSLQLLQKGNTSHFHNLHLNTMPMYAVIGAIAGVIILLAIGAALYCAMSNNKKKKADIFIPTETYEAYENPIWKKAEVDRGEPLERLAALKMFSFIDLQSATDDFSPSCVIKGSVYRGKINGDLAAIKRMKTDVSKEINLLAKINHFNLVRVLGVCFNEGQCYIVYEYASKGPLSGWIYYGDSDDKFLSWTQRIQIILDIARGLNHIHSYFSPALVHMGVKISNVLLDSDLRGKIANFGLVRSATGDQESQASGKGYLCPDFLRTGQVSPKLDVYAFGVLMLEMLTGKHVVVLLESVKTRLPEVLVGVLGEEDGKESLKSLIDPSLRGNYPSDQAIFMFGLIDNCLKQDPSNRPGMEENVRSLSKVLTASLSWESSGA